MCGQDQKLKAFLLDSIYFSSAIWEARSFSKSEKEYLDRSFAESYARIWQWTKPTEKKNNSPNLAP